MKSLIRGSTLPKLPKNKLLKIKIPYFEIEVLNEIVKQLESLEKQKQNFDNLIGQTKKEMEFYMNCKIKKACKNNCEFEKLGKLIEFLKKSKRKSKDGKKKGLYPLYYCSILNYLYIDEYDFNDEGIVINTTNGSGRARVFYAKGKYSTAQSVFHFKSKVDNILTGYLYYYMNSRIKDIEKLYTGANQKSIKKDSLEKIKIPVIDMKLQNIIVNYLNDRQNEINNLEIRKTQIDELMKEILESSFSGDSSNDDEEKVEENESE
jgi:restriction endonuclease S subunit